VFKLLKNGHCFTPGDAGKKDILVAYGTICRMEDWIGEDNLWDVEVFDCSGKIVCPGLIDQHVHIVGGGGEEGPVSRIPEIMLGDIISAGVTTLVGVLGVDDITKKPAPVFDNGGGSFIATTLYTKDSHLFYCTILLL